MDQEGYEDTKEEVCSSSEEVRSSSTEENDTSTRSIERGDSAAFSEREAQTLGSTEGATKESNTVASYDEVKSEVREQGLGRIDPNEVGSDKDYDQPTEGDTEFTDPNNVGLFATVDVSDASDEEVKMYREMATIFEEQFKQFVEKNQGYSSSFLTSGEVEQDYDGGPFDTAHDANLYGVWKRQQDKDQRFYERAFNGTDSVDEPLAETTADAMNYWAILTWLSEFGGDK